MEKPTIALEKSAHRSCPGSGFMEQTQVSGYSFSTECSWKGRVRHFRHKSVTQKSHPQPQSQLHPPTVSVVRLLPARPKAHMTLTCHAASFRLQLCLSYRTVTLLRNSDTSKDRNFVSRTLHALSPSPSSRRNSAQP